MAKIKTTGKEWNDFISSKWKAGQYIEDLDITINGIQGDDIEISDDAIVVADGYILNQDNFDEKAIMLSLFFKKWRSTKTNKTLLIEIDNSFVDELKVFLKNKGRILQ